MKTMTVEAAIAPLLKIQKNLQAVVAARAKSAERKRADAATLQSSARADDEQQLKADRILAKLLKLTDPEE